MAFSLFTDRNRSNGGSGNYLDFFNENVSCLRSKFIEIINNMCSLDFKIMRLMETWLNQSHSTQIFSRYLLYIVVSEAVTLNYLMEEFYS
jgi:hypothetical protein